MARQHTKVAPLARPVLSPDRLESVEENLKRGVTRKRALRIAGFKPDEVRALETLAECGVEPYATFAVAMDKAEATVEERLLKVIAESKDWRAAESLLKRKFPEEWGDKIQLEVKAEVERLFKVAEEVLPLEWYEKLVNAAAGGGAGAADPPAELGGAIH